ncbi:MAG: hypothetical protein AB7U82_34930 [Blastocatellales bacterium]
MAVQIEFGFAPRPKLRLARVEELIQKHCIIDPPPSRQTLINWIEEGILEGKLTQLGWIVYQDSFIEWARSLEAEECAA